MASGAQRVEAAQELGADAKPDRPGGTAPRDRRAAGPPDPGPARSDPHHPRLRRHDPGVPLRDLLRRRRLRRSRCAAHRSRLQARLRPAARHRGRPVLAADPVSTGERPPLSRRDPPHLRPGGCWEGLLSAGARGGDARHRACPEPVEGTPAKSSTVTSSSHCSTPITTSGVSCPSTSTTPSAAGLSPWCCARGRRRPASRCLASAARVRPTLKRPSAGDSYRRRKSQR